MRIVDRKTFLAMPAGTVFCKYEPIIHGDLLIKGDTVAGVDFRYQELHDAWPVGVNDDGDMADLYFRAQETGEELPPPDLDCEGRDGLFDEDQLFIVYSFADVQAIIERLQRAISQSLNWGGTVPEISVAVEAMKHPEPFPEGKP